MRLNDVQQEAQFEAAYLRGEPLEPLFLKIMEAELKEFEDSNNVGRTPQLDDVGSHPGQTADEPQSSGPLPAQGA